VRGHGGLQHRRAWFTIGCGKTRDVQMSVKDIETDFRTRLDKFGELGATVKFDFATEMLFIDGTKQPAVMSSADDDADCTLSITPDDLQRILDGELDATMAFMTGKLKVKGSTSVAMKLAGALK
jgi:putative sterol carrier protein